METPEVLTLLRHHQTDLQQRGARSLSLFGSFARNTANPDSDIDLLVDLDEQCGFFELFRLRYYLEGLLNRPIDLGTPDSLRDHIRDDILKEAIHIF